MGAQIEGAGTSTIRIQGVEQLRGAEHTIIADRIEAGTFLIAGAITGGDLTVTGCDPRASGRARVQAATGRGRGDTARRHARCASAATGRLRSVDMTTEEYPGFATDLQAQYMALMTQAEGIAIVAETIFENRFMHAQELARMGANIRLDGRQAIVAGPRELTGAGVIASDLRASASLVLAALVAQGETVIDRVYHIDRGYEKIEAKLARRGRQNPARGVERSMAHNPGFLKLVNDAKSRVKEIDIDGVSRRCATPARRTFWSTRAKTTSGPPGTSPARST